MTTPKTKKKTPKSKSKTPRARARIPVVSPISSDEDEDRYRAALTVSSGQRRHRSKLFHDPGAESGRHSSTINSNGSYVRGTVKELLKKNDSVLVRIFSLIGYMGIGIESSICGTSYTSEEMLQHPE